MPSRVELKGSHRTQVRNAGRARRPDPNEILDITVILRRIAPLPKPMPGKQTVTRKDFAAKYGARPEDAALLEAHAAEHDCTVREINLARRSLVVSGTLANVSRAFGVSLGNIRLFKTAAGWHFRGRHGTISVPPHLGSVVEAVFGIDNRPQARGGRRRPETPVARHAAWKRGMSYTPAQIARFYDFPEGLTGAGQTIGLIEIEGGCRMRDFNAYLRSQGIPKPPSVVLVSVDHAINAPTGNLGIDLEVMMDMEIVGALAPGANQVVYFCSSDDRSALDALSTAVHDPRGLSILSISAGIGESLWSEQSRHFINQTLQEAALFGMTVCVATGDNGSGDGVRGGEPNVDFPASSPYALACGGTRLESLKGKFVDEVVWNTNSRKAATGGGVSRFFGLPDYQKGARVPARPGAKARGRGIPDVSGHADWDLGYRLLVDGRRVPLGGTSAVAPLWAALIARINEKLGKPAGFINPKLYAHPEAFRDITVGNNGFYKAKKGWDACTGLGTPIGTKILEALK